MTHLPAPWLILWLTVVTCSLGLLTLLSPSELRHYVIGDGAKLLTAVITAAYLLTR